MWLEGPACHDNVNVVAAAAFWRRSPADSNRAAAKAAPCKILLRITANLMSAFSQLKSRHGASQRTPMQRFILRAVRGTLDLLIIRPRQPSSTPGGTITQPKRCSANLGQAEYTRLTHLPCLGTPLCPLAPNFRHARDNVG